jgi:hypothetical protein
MAVAENLVAANRHAYNMFNAGVTLLGIANGNITSLTTVKGTNTTTSLEGMIRNITCHENLVRFREQLADQMAACGDMGLLSNSTSGTSVTAANDLAGMRTIFTTNNGAAVDTTFPTFAWAR